MKFMTIGEVTRTFDVSTRTLRYYDEIGLLPSARKDDYAYRVYDESAVRRLRQIITLRKLRVPLKKIALIFNDSARRATVEILQESLNELGEEITALKTIRDILRAFVERLNQSANDGIEIGIGMLGDDEIVSAVRTLSLSKIKLKEERSMDDLNEACKKLSALTDVRVVYLPPCAVAASHFFGDDPEANAGMPLEEFIRSVGLVQIKPDFRQYGFNNPCPAGDETYGYEFWATIPDDLDVPAPLIKKRFVGGLYAAHCISMGNFFEWEYHWKWVAESAEYEYDEREPAGMLGTLEEHLNAYSYYSDDAAAARFTQLDLPIPIKSKQ